MLKGVCVRCKVGVTKNEDGGVVEMVQVLCVYLFVLYLCVSAVLCIAVVKRINMRPQDDRSMKGNVDGGGW